MYTYTATFRFYEELNDFLPIEKRKLSFPYHFNNSPSLKDAIEAIGIPHVEVDLIIVNGNPADFKALLKDHDFISVYPVFESFNISGITGLHEKPLRQSLFILDVHLGKLTRYLRLLGFDSIYRNNWGDNEIIKLSLDQKRIILTRDKGLLKVKSVTHGYWIRNENPKLQVKDVLRRFDLNTSIKPFCRCIICNGLIGTIDKKAIEDNLEPMTKEYFDDYYTCETCGKIYWKGSHFNRMQQFISQVTNISLEY